MEITRGDNMAFKKITSSELSSRGATTLPDQPTISAQALKEEFDAPAKEIVAPKFNTLIDDLSASSAASNIGISTPTGLSATSVQDIADLAHTHENKEVLDKFSEVGGDPYYDGEPIGGGGSGNTFKTVKVGTSNIVASGDDTLEIRAGSNVTLAADTVNKVVTINSAGGGGQSTGDMLAADYDSDYAVKSAGGIAAYQAAHDTTYTAGTNVQISNANVISATDTTYTAGTNITIDSNNVISAAGGGSSVSVSYTGTASATGVRKQIITVDGTPYTVDGSSYMEQTKNLSTTQDTTFTFAHSDILSTSEIRVFTSIFGLAPKDVTTENGQCVVTFDKYSAAQSLKVRIRIA